MKVNRLTKSIDEHRLRWVGLMAKSSTPCWPPDNPALVDVIAKTWGWRQQQVAFFFGGRLLALLSASKIRDLWMSLPHFDHGAIWVDVEWLTLKLKNSENREIDALGFYLYFIQQFLQIADNDKKGDSIIKLFEVELDEIVPFSDSGEINIVKRFRCRSHISLLQYFDDSKVVPVISLPETEINILDIFPSNVRRKIRKSFKNGITVKSGGSELLDLFYGVYTANIKKHGSFGLPKCFIRNLLDHYKNGKVKIVLAYYEESVVGAAIIQTFNGVAENIAFATLESFNYLYVSYALHYSMMKIAINQNCKTYSFGRSTAGSSGHHYKKQWGTTDVPLFFNDSAKGVQTQSSPHFINTILRHIPCIVRQPFDNIVSYYKY